MPQSTDLEGWLAAQPMYDAISGLDGVHQPPQSVAEWVAQESAYAPDINDGVRVNMRLCKRPAFWPLRSSQQRTWTRPLQTEQNGVLTNDVGAAKANFRNQDGGPWRRQMPRDKTSFHEWLVTGSMQSCRHVVPPPLLLCVTRTVNGWTCFARRAPRADSSYGRTPTSMS